MREIQMGRNNNPEPAGGWESQRDSVPRNIEVLIKKASVDPEFRRLLLDKRAEAAREIDLDLSQAEADMLAGMPCEQLERIIEKTRVAPEQRAVFSGSFGRIMLATVIAGAAISVMVPSLGHTLTGEQREHILRQQELLRAEMERSTDPNDVNDAEPDSDGIEEGPPGPSDMNES
jgi:hypothetical protein